MRGDRPRQTHGNLHNTWFTPHARGSTGRGRVSFSFLFVYPACAGIDLNPRFYVKCRIGLPRMRGDRPLKSPSGVRTRRFTPHARGSTGKGWKSCSQERVYPACAGIDRPPIQVPYATTGLPRMRGDRPSREMPFPETLEFTPHARGSTWIVYVYPMNTVVYPACAGIDLRYERLQDRHIRLPRMRGDRPVDNRGILDFPKFTPHARGSTG